MRKREVAYAPIAASGAARAQPTRRRRIVKNGTHAALEYPGKFTILSRCRLVFQLLRVLRGL